MSSLLPLLPSSFQVMYIQWKCADLLVPIITYLFKENVFHTLFQLNSASSVLCVIDSYSKYIFIPINVSILTSFFAYSGWKPIQNVPFVLIFDIFLKILRNV